MYARNRVLQASTGGWSGPPAEDEGAEGGAPALDAGLQVGVSQCRVQAGPAPDPDPDCSAPASMLRSTPALCCSATLHHPDSDIAHPMPGHGSIRAVHPGNAGEFRQPAPGPHPQHAQGVTLEKAQGDGNASGSACSCRHWGMVIIVLPCLDNT